MKIVLLGYMASGKSLIAKELAKKMDALHIDLDTYIEQKEGKKIVDIFDDEGEIKFRLLENKYLSNLLRSKKAFVLSVGGGTPCYANNMKIITEHTQSFFLKASIVTLYDRLLEEKKKRPLIAKIANENLKEFIAKHLFERNLYYNRASHIIKVDDKSLQEIIKNLQKLI